MLEDSVPSAVLILANYIKTINNSRDHRRLAYSFLTLEAQVAAVGISAGFLESTPASKHYPAPESIFCQIEVTETLI